MTGRRKRGRPRIVDIPGAVERRQAAADAFRDARIAKGLRQIDVAKALDVSRQAVSQWESGDRAIPARARAWMADR